MKKFGIKHQKQLFQQNLHHHTLVFSWMKWKLVFLKHNNCNNSFCLDILITYFLYGHTMKDNSSISTNFIQT